MTWNGKDHSADGVSERGFELEIDGRAVPGVYWTADGPSLDRVVLLGHGGTTHKKADYIEGLARNFVRHGLAAMALDGPGHGERAVDVTGVESVVERLTIAWASGGWTDGVVADWTAALDFLEAEEGGRPTGWWGLSMGTMMGLPLAAADQRIRAAVFGLMGAWGPIGSELLNLAPDVRCPVRFLVQWHDQLVPRGACFELFDRLGSAKKTLHANPGAHAGVPMFEVKESVEHLLRHVC